MAYSETRFTFDSDGDTNRTVRRDYVGRFVGIIVALALLAIGMLAYRAANPPASFGTPLASSTVKVQLAESHGSGVHIGGGMILTAAHVAKEGDTVSLKLDNGTTRDATVIWVSSDSDVAMLRTSPYGLADSPLSCAPPVDGQSVTARGNPLVLEFTTTYGHITGAPRAFQDWQSVVPVDMVILPGMSGGPTFNEAGEVVGINVAVLTLPLGLTSSVTGLGLIVPSSHICSLLGRT